MGDVEPRSLTRLGSPDLGWDPGRLRGRGCPEGVAAGGGPGCWQVPDGEACGRRQNEAHMMLAAGKERGRGQVWRAIKEAKWPALRDG